MAYVKANANEWHGISSEKYKFQIYFINFNNNNNNKHKKAPKTSCLKLFMLFLAQFFSGLPIYTHSKRVQFSLNSCAIFMKFINQTQIRQHYPFSISLQTSEEYAEQKIKQNKSKQANSWPQRQHHSSTA